MRKKTKLAIALSAIIVVVLSFASFFNRSKFEDVRNEFCPVSGKPVDGVSTYTHKGKRYNLCSPGCAGSLSTHAADYTSSEEK